MNERQRADELAKAIEDLLRGVEPELEDEELVELLQIARIRRQASLEAARTGAPYQSIVWERMVARIKELLEERDQRPNGISNEAETAGVCAASGDPEENPDSAEWRQLISLRRQMTERVMDMAEAYRDVVWQRVQSRIEVYEARQAEKRGLFRWRLPSFIGRHQRADELSEAVDRLILGEPVWEAEDSKLKELLQTARMRQALSKALVTSAAPYQARLWAYLRPRLMVKLDPGRKSEPKPSRGWRFGTVAWPKLAAVAAGLALVVFAVGPLPATGLADHPITQFIRFVSHYAGVTETDTPPSVPPPTEGISGIDVTIEEARDLLDLPVRAPAYLPDGFRHTASTYFPQAITDNEGGMLMLAYEMAIVGDAPPTIVIYQERVSDNTVAVQRGFAQPVVLTNGIEGTYYEGAWQPQGEEIVWGESGAQTIIFDEGSVRTIILYLDSEKMDRQQLVAIANSMLGSSGS